MTRDKEGKFMKGHIQHQKGTHVSVSTEFKKGHNVPEKWRTEHSEKMKGKTPWNKIKLNEEEILRLYNKNFSIFKIAEKFNCSVRPICRILKENSIKRRNNGDYLQGNTYKELYGEELATSIKERHSKRMSGEKNPAWLSGKSFEPYDKSFNNKFKRAIRKRDNQVCMLCGIHREKLNEALTIHHINYDKKLTIPQNCISLCRKCHGLTTVNRKQYIIFFQDLLSKLYDYQYSNNEIVLEVKNG